jgi:hypothetical protein
MARKATQDMTQKEMDQEIARLEQAAKVQKFILRNFVVENMYVIVAYARYRDPKTGKKIEGRAIFLVLLAMTKHAWKPIAAVWPGNKSLAAMTGLSPNYVELCKRAMVSEKIVEHDGQSKIHTDRYLFRYSALVDFVELAKLKVEAPPMPEYLAGFVPDPDGDAAEEELMWKAEGVASGEVEQSTDDSGFNPLADETERDVYHD